MEEKREIVYSDISSALRKQPYDAMVYIEGTSVIAVDSDGRKIATGTAGTDDATNITVAIKKPDNSAGTTQTVYWRAEV